LGYVRKSDGDISGEIIPNNIYIYIFIYIFIYSDGFDKQWDWDLSNNGYSVSKTISHPHSDGLDHPFANPHGDSSWDFIPNNT